MENSTEKYHPLLRVDICIFPDCGEVYKSFFFEQGSSEKERIALIDSLLHLEGIRNQVQKTNDIWYKIVEIEEIEIPFEQAQKLLQETLFGRNMENIEEKSVEISLKAPIECTVVTDGTFYNTARQTSHQKDEKMEKKMVSNLYGYCTIKENDVEFFNLYRSYGSSSTVILRVKLSDLKKVGIKNICKY